MIGSACSMMRSASSGALACRAAFAASIERRAARSVSPAARACRAISGSAAGEGSPPSSSRRLELRCVASGGPYAVDLLDHARLAVGARQLLDDEWHALGLGVDGGRRGRVDRSTQRLRGELAALKLAESPGPKPAHQPH